MTKTKAYIIAIVFCAIFPIRWWEGKPILAIIFIIVASWFTSAGTVINPLYFIGTGVLYLYELVTIPGRLEKENERMDRSLND